MRWPTLPKGRPVGFLVVLFITFTLFSFCYYCLEYGVVGKTNISQNVNRSLVSCDTDFINSEKMAMKQDDPCIVNVIRERFLLPPSEKKLNLDDPTNHNPSMGQSDIVLDILKDKKNGFFVECGALDGELRSNTLYMEQHLGWQGVLIEADPKNFQKVSEKNRRAWTVPACLSTSPYPKRVLFNQAFNTGRISQNEKDDEKREESVRVQCFPFFSILSALNRTQIDYFSLDIEGDEFAVLKTIPWNRVDITMLSVEFIHDREDKNEIKEYMEQRGYEIVKPDPSEFGDSVANDFIFKKRKMTYR